MKEKIITELKKKHSGQLTAKFMESLAERLSAKVEKEEDIQGVIDELDNSPIKLTDLQAEGDRRATELQKKIDELQGQTKMQPIKDTVDDTVIGQLKKFSEKLEQLERDNKKEKARSALLQRLKEKDIPAVLLENVTVDAVEQVDEVVEKLERQATELRKQLGVQLPTDPPRRATGPDSKTEQIINDLKTIKPR